MFIKTTKKDYVNYCSPVATIWVYMPAVVVAIIVTYLLFNNTYEGEPKNNL